MAAARIRLGIDFGTSNTVAALAGADGRIRHLVLDGSPLLASAVFAGDGSDLFVGGDAVRAASGEPAAFEGNPKRRIDDRTVWLGERDVPVVELIGAVLGRVAAEAVRVAGAPADEVVLTHPAAWGRPRLGVLALAAERAGLQRVRFVSEPVAAAAYFASVLGERVVAGRSIVIYDLGAGTFDVSVVRSVGHGFEVLAADGLSDIGGLDLDAAVVAHARACTGDEAAAWERLDWPKVQADHRSRRTLWLDARAVKEQLSRHASGVLHVPLTDRQLQVTRAEFEAAARPLLERTVELTHRLLRVAGVPPEQVAGVFLVGGSSRIPMAATLLHRTLRIAPTIIDQPELVVAEGALYARSVGEPDFQPAQPNPARAKPVPMPRQAPDDLPQARAVGGGPGNRVWRRSWSVAAAAFAVVVAMVAWYLVANAHSPAANAGPAQRSSGPASATQRSTTPSVVTRPAATTPATPATGASLPTGWVTHVDATGYAVAAPGTMTPTQTGTHLLFTEPSRSMFLLVDQTDQPRSDPLADLQGKEKVKNIRCGDGFDTTTYQYIAITRVDYSPEDRSGVAHAANAADWEYTCQHGGVGYHVLYRDFVTGPRHAYAIIWTTTPMAWEGLRSSLDTVFDSFVPADN